MLNFRFFVGLMSFSVGTLCPRAGSSACMVGDIFNRRTADIWLISNLLVMHTWLASGFTKNGWYHTSVVAPWYLVTSIKVFGPSELVNYLEIYWCSQVHTYTYIFSPLNLLLYNDASAK